MRHFDDLRPGSYVRAEMVQVNACLDDPKLQARIVELGYLVFKTSQAEFSSFVAESTEKWANIIRAANIRAE